MLNPCLLQKLQIVVSELISIQAEVGEEEPGCSISASNIRKFCEQMTRGVIRETAVAYLVFEDVAGGISFYEGVLLSDTIPLRMSGRNKDGLILHVSFAGDAHINLLNEPADVCATLTVDDVESFWQHPEEAGITLRAFSSEGSARDWAHGRIFKTEDTKRFGLRACVTIDERESRGVSVHGSEVDVVLSRL